MPVASSTRAATAYRQLPRDDQDLGEDIFEPSFFERASAFVSANLKRWFIPLLVSVSVLIVILLAVLLAIRPTGRKSSPSDSPNAGFPWTDIRLPTDVVPHHYDLNITTEIRDRNTSVWSGTGAIDIQVLKSTNKIVLHAHDLNVTNITLHNKADNTNFPVFLHLDNSVNGQHNLVFDHTIDPSNYTLTFDFAGVFGSRLAGYYLSQYQGPNNKPKLLATTQFEATDARRAFPCFDEPSLKATFKIRMITQKGLHALSNMNILGTYPLVRNGEKYQMFDFAITKRMSTYLVAFVVSDFESISTKTKRGVDVAVWTQPGQRHLGKYALDAATVIIDRYEQLFGVEYPLPKSDLISIPDFAAGAMENWGLITYRDTALLYDEKKSSIVNKQRVATVVAHELGHQWFGNLVTMDWWDSLWLNEGFATFCEYIGADAVEPHLRLHEQFYLDNSMRALVADSSNYTHSIHANVSNPAEIQELFDAISYSKGGASLRMLQNFLEIDSPTSDGSSPFFNGLRKYLLKHAYGNAKTDDLWDSLNTANVNVREFMTTWTEQPGYPLLTFGYGNDKSSLTVNQQRFFTSRVATASNQSWMIPLTYTIYTNTSGQPKLYEQSKLHVIKANENSTSITIPIPSRNTVTFIKPNTIQKGFYRSHIPEDMLFIASEWLQSCPTFLEPVDKAGLIEDTFAMLMAGRLDRPEVALELTRYLSHEDDFIVWSSVFVRLSELNHLFSVKSGYGYFRSYVASLLDKVVLDLGWDADKKDKNADVRSLLRGKVLSWAVLMGHKDTVNKALHYFGELHNSKDINLTPDVLSSVYTAAIVYGDEEAYNIIHDKLVHGEFAPDIQRYLSALAKAQQPYLIERNLELALSDQVRSQDKISFLRQIVAGSPIGPIIVFNYLRDNWITIMDQLGHGGTFLSLNSLLTSLTSRFTSQSLIDEAYTMFNNRTLPKPARSDEAVAKGLDEAKTNVWWIEKYGTSTLDWFRVAVLEQQPHRQRGHRH